MLKKASRPVRRFSFPEPGWLAEQPAIHQVRRGVRYTLWVGEGRAVWLEAPDDPPAQPGNVIED